MPLTHSAVVAEDLLGALTKQLTRLRMNGMSPFLVWMLQAEQHSKRKRREPPTQQQTKRRKPPRQHRTKRRRPPRELRTQRRRPPRQTRPNHTPCDSSLRMFCKL